MKFLGTPGLPVRCPHPWNPGPRWGHALLPLSGSKGFSEVARFANWKKTEEKVRSPGPEPIRIPSQYLTVRTSPMTAIGVSPLAWATRCSIR